MARETYKHQKKQVTVRLNPDKYETYRKLCHLEFRQMADVARELIESWIERQKKKTK